MSWSFCQRFVKFFLCAIRHLLFAFGGQLRDPVGQTRFQFGPFREQPLFLLGQRISYRFCEAGIPVFRFVGKAGLRKAKPEILFQRPKLRLAFRDGAIERLLFADQPRKSLSGGIDGLADAFKPFFGSFDEPVEPFFFLIRGFVPKQLPPVEPQLFLPL